MSKGSFAAVATIGLSMVLAQGAVVQAAEVRVIAGSALSPVVLGQSPGHHKGNERGGSQTKKDRHRDKEFMDKEFMHGRYIRPVCQGSRAALRSAP